MKYKEFKVLLEQSAPNTVSIIVYFEDNTTQAVDDIPLSVFNSPNFRTQLEDKLLRKYNKIVVRYSRVGDDTNQGNPDGNTLDTEIPKTLTSPDGEEEIEQTPDEVKDTDPQTIAGAQLVSSADLARRQNAYADRVDKDRDNKHDETGADVWRMNNQMQYVDADGNLAPGGSGGGGVTGEQEAEVPSIIEQLFASMDGLGTDEGGMIAALKRIVTPAHFIEVKRQYEKEYGSPLGKDIKGEFTYEALGFSPNIEMQLDELNQEMQRLGWKLVRQSQGLSWKKYTGANN
jgi:hypothetical protein|tara:strand:+ start:299 stop:1162 length:864 start_codon:yes stop_codon:yes gene_type:complete